MPEYYDSFDEVDHHSTYLHDPYDRVTTVYNEDYHDEEFTPVVDVTKAYLEPPPPTMPPTTSYSAMYYDTPGHNDVGNDNYDTPMDKIDDHIEVFESLEHQGSFQFFYFYSAQPHMLAFPQTLF